jgi:HTH-like domain
MRRIDELHLEAPFYGARKITAQLQREGHDIGRRHVRTLMRQMRIEALYRKPRTSIPARGATIYPYLLDNLVIDRPNQVWSTDLTYLPMAHGFMYLMDVQVAGISRNRLLDLLRRSDFSGQRKNPELLPLNAADCACSRPLTKNEDEETIIINRPGRSTYPEEKSVLTSGATSVRPLVTKSSTSSMRAVGGNRSTISSDHVNLQFKFAWRRALDG